jgi:ubiquinone/menaquinone biosynthesis C-methylase UbiE
MSAQPVTDIETLFRPTHDERARQQFVSTLRKHAIVDLRNMMKRDWEGRVEPALESRGEAPQEWRGIERAMEKEDSFRFYSAVRYNAQEMSFLSVQGTVERALPGMIEVAKDAAARNPAGGSLRIPEDFEVPRYVSSLDVHLIPGSFDAEYTGDDVAQGAVVAFGSKVFAGQHPFRKKPGAVAESVGNWLRLKHPDFRPRRILDLATTSGKNLFPYAGTFPGAELHGVDVGAPLLRFGHALAEAAGLPVHFSQQNAESLDFPDGHFDLIVSSFFFHEIPLKSTRKVLRECFRLLAPGGMMVHMELPNEAAVSPYENFFWNWDTAYNAEPFYTTYRAQDPVELSVEAGFERDRSFAHLIPDWLTFGEERFRRFVRGELPSPSHGSGGWFVFGSQKA